MSQRVLARVRMGAGCSRGVAACLFAGGALVFPQLDSRATANDGCAPTARSGPASAIAGIGSGTGEGGGCAVKFLPTPPSVPLDAGTPWVVAVPAFPADESPVANVRPDPAGLRLAAASSAGTSAGGNAAICVEMCFEKKPLSEMLDLLDVDCTEGDWCGKAGVGLAAWTEASGSVELCSATPCTVDLRTRAFDVTVAGEDRVWASSMEWRIVDAFGNAPSVWPPAHGTLPLESGESVDELADSAAWSGVLPAGEWRLVVELEVKFETLIERAGSCTDELLWSRRNEASGSLVVGERPSADLDGSGCVDNGDVALVLMSYGEPGGAADLDGDGTIGFGDVAFVLLAFGECL